MWHLNMHQCVYKLKTTKSTRKSLDCSAVSCCAISHQHQSLLNNKLKTSGKEVRGGGWGQWGTWRRQAWRCWRCFWWRRCRGKKGPSASLPRELLRDSSPELITSSHESSLWRHTQGYAVTIHTQCLYTQLIKPLSGKVWILFHNFSNVSLHI